MSDPLDEALDTETLRGQLAQHLRLADAGVGVEAIHMIGNGSNAAVAITLTNGLTISTEKFGDLWTHTGLARFITQNTGIRARGLTKDDAEEANALIRRLAKIERDTTTADLGRDHGYDFLGAAPVVDFTLFGDQGSRYEAFARVDALDPVQAFEQRDILGHGLTSVAAASLVLKDEESRDRYVHCGHLFDDVRARRRVASPVELARRMELAGWTRRGKRGRIKATPLSGIGAPIVLPLWRVPSGWEDTASEGEA